MTLRQANHERRYRLVGETNLSFGMFGLLSSDPGAGWRADKA